MRFFTLSAAAAVALATTVSATTDIDTLNYALTLEHLEDQYYSQGLATFSQTDFTAAGYGDQYTTVQLIAGHEAAHVKYLQTVITSLGGTPASACNTYNFGSYFVNVSTFLGSAYTFEQIGVQAYDGAINSISNPALQQGAATIATIEARHATYLQQYFAPTQVPNATAGAFDVALTPDQVVNAAGGLLGSGNCTTFTKPVARTAPSNYSTAYVAGTASTLQQNDINALNYALFLENFEAAFYAHYVGTSSSSNAVFNAASFSTQDGSQAAGTTLARLQLIANHEQTHANYLNSALASSAISTCTKYTWPELTASSFLTTAATIENAGVTAYDGAINAITNPAFAQVAATIATVEARHADYLLAVSGQTQLTKDQSYNNGTGGAFDSAASPSSIAATVKSLNIIDSSCFSQVVLPATVSGTSSTATNKNAAGATTVSYASVVAAIVVAVAAVMA